MFKKRLSTCFQKDQVVGFVPLVIFQACLLEMIVEFAGSNLEKLEIKRCKFFFSIDEIKFFIAFIFLTVYIGDTRGLRIIFKYTTFKKISDNLRKIEITIYNNGTLFNCLM